MKSSSWCGLEKLVAVETVNVCPKNKIDNCFPVKKAHFYTSFCILEINSEADNYNCLCDKELFSLFF